MNAEVLRNVTSIQEFFKIPEDGPIPEGTRLLLEAMTEVPIPAGQDVVTYGEEPEDGMYIILEGVTEVYSNKGTLINTLGKGDFIGELGLINDDKRGATVRAKTNVVCANISKQLFEDIAMANRKIYGTFMNMLYTKTTKLVTEQERIRSELSIATKIQAGCLENDFSEFNNLPCIEMTAAMRPAKEVGGDFYDVFKIDENRFCFLVSDVSGKGVPAALFMTMAKTHLKNYVSLGMPLAEAVSRANNQLCYKNEEGMFVTSFICVLDITTNEVTFVNAGHDLPLIRKANGSFEVITAKVNLVLGMMEDIPYKAQSFELLPGDSIYLYTDGVNEALNPEQELLGMTRLREMLNRHDDLLADAESFVQAMFKEVDDYANGEQQADDITMLYVTRIKDEK